MGGKNPGKPQGRRTGGGGGETEETEKPFHSKQYEQEYLDSLLNAKERPTWDEFKEQQRKKGEMEGDMAKLEEEAQKRFRKELDEERAARLAHGTNRTAEEAAAGQKKQKKDKHKKKKRERSDDDDSSSEDDEAERKRRKKEKKEKKERKKEKKEKEKKEKHKKKKRRKDSDSDSSSSDDDEGRKSKKAEAPVSLSSFFAAGDDSD
tara:strand:+ start:258 stop:875 length:618 start_codon:yes stop_codon:yes gene_type:complete